MSRCGCGEITEIRCENTDEDLALVEVRVVPAWRRGTCLLAGTTRGASITLQVAPECADDLIESEGAEWAEVAS